MFCINFEVASFTLGLHIHGRQLQTSSRHWGGVTHSQLNNNNYIIIISLLPWEIIFPSILFQQFIIVPPLFWLAGRQDQASPRIWYPIFVLWKAHVSLSKLPWVANAHTRDAFGVDVHWCLFGLTNESRSAKFGTQPHFIIKCKRSVRLAQHPIMNWPWSSIHSPKGVLSKV